MLMQCALLAILAADLPPLGIPLKPDPPIAIDGELDEWVGVPNALTIDQAAQCVHGPGSWTGPADCSAIVHTAWRQEALFVACEVTDDAVHQAQTGESLWKGDHLELYLDVKPDLEPDRAEFGAGQFQLVLSPGNFRQTGDPLTDTRPEAFIYRPAGTPAGDVRVAARKTAAGYAIEAAIPWELLGLQPVAGAGLAMEVGLSDTDSAEPRQELLMTTMPDTWAHRRARLRPAALAAADGVATPAPRAFPIAAEVTIGPAEQTVLKFDAPAVPEGRIGVLVFKARLHSPRVGGHTPALRLLLNGAALAGDRLVNKPARAPARSGDVYSLYAGDVLRLFYAPDYTSADQDQHYGLLNGVPACDFQMDVTDRLKVGANELTVVYGSDKVSNPLHLAEVGLELRYPPPPEAAKRPAPTGPLEVYEPAADHAVTYQLETLADNRLKVTVNGQAFALASRFSTPEPGWATGSNAHFDYQRTIDRRPEAVVITETFRNKTASDLGIMQRHEATAAQDPRAWYLAGRPIAAGRGNSGEPANPTTYVATDSAGLGLLPLSDAMRLHTLNWLAGQTIGLGDNQLVLPAGGSTVVEWAILPTAVPSYLAFLNAARRLMDVNFPLDGAFCFFRAHPTLTATWSDEQTKRFMEYKDAKYVCASIPSVGGIATQGTPFQSVDPTIYKEQFARRKQLKPDIATLVYFHCFLDVSPDGPTRFADARTLKPDGSQADYGKDAYKLYFPRDDNSYGPAIAKNVDAILDGIGADGVYWDEHEYSAFLYHYGEPWDGLSGDIDPTTMKVVRRKSAVPLITEDWRVKMAQYIQSRGPLIGNGCPRTKRMMALRFPCFVETGSISNCTRAQLWSPIALGDHLTERSELDAYRVMLAALNYGCVYHWYNDLNVIPTHHTLVRYMYPITPVELHEGYLLGAERIITNRSGLFGFGDVSEHEVHVFNDQGVEVPDFEAPRTVVNGKSYSELRLAEDWSAAILRR